MISVARLGMVIAGVCGLLIWTPAWAAPDSSAAASGDAPAAGLAGPGAPAVSPTDQAAADPAVADYVLGSGDNLRISVFGEDSLTGQFTVASNGHISFPLIGDVQASGKTVREVREEIAAALADGYIKDPRVSAEVMTFRPYYILGEVEKPGEYPYIGGITVMNAIATAGGFTYRANNHDVFIKKPNETTEHKVRLNDTIELSPGDTLRVGERYF
jgi:polysaccharide biosynthesis/export protein VpsN